MKWIKNIVMENRKRFEENKDIIQYKDENISQGSTLSKFRHNCGKNQGFTLVELVVIMTIMSILIGLTAWGILGWQDWVDFKRQNEYAQTLFVAAQNQLAEYSANGELEELEGKIPESQFFTNDQLKVMTDANGAALTKGKIWDSINKGQGAVEDGTTNAAQSAYEGKLCYVTVGKADYNNFVNNNWSDTEEDTQKQVLYQILSSYVYNTGLLNAAITIEFSPENGQIYAVLYSDKDDAFEYNTANKSNREIVDISNRQRSYRKERMVGYYGVDTLSQATSVKLLKPSINNVKLNNEETLNLSFKLSRVKEATQALTYEITIHDDQTKGKLIQIILDGTKLENTTQAIRCAVTNYSNSETSKMYIPAWVETDASGDSVVRIVLDAADKNATSAKYLDSAQDFKNTYSCHRFGLPEKKNIYCTVQGKGALYKTTAVKESNIENPYFASSQSSAVNGETTTTYGIKNCRHLYNMRYLEDNTDTSSEKNIYKLRADIDWETFVDDGKNFYNSKNYYDSKDMPDASVDSVLDKIAVEKVSKVTAPINNLNTVSQAVEGETESPILLSEAEDPTSDDFPAIVQLRAGNIFESDGSSKRYTINHIELSDTANVGANLYSNEALGLVLPKMVNDNNNKIASQKRGDEQSAILESPTGLFLVNNGSITNINLDNVTVKGNQYVGAFAAVNGFGGSLSNLAVNSSDNDASYGVQGYENVGGIVGAQAQLYEGDDLVYKDETSNLSTQTKKEIVQKQIDDMFSNTVITAENLTTSTTYDALINRATVTGSHYVGGTIGQLKAYKYVADTEENSTSYEFSITVSGCENYGAVEGVVSEKDKTANSTVEEKTLPTYIGGIVGYSQNQIAGEAINSNSTEEDIKELTGKLTISNCKSSPQYQHITSENAEVTETASFTNEKMEEKMLGVFVGGIAGYNDYAQIVGCSTEKEEGKEGYIFGYQYVGGIVGFNVGPASGVSGSTTGENTTGTNEANVIGCKYVGGIVGCNASIKKDANGQTRSDKNNVLEPETTKDLSVRISNWVNKGTVLATENYVGGITGYNTGFIYNCNSEVGYSEEKKSLTNAASKQGDYAGGIAGYNNGIIGSTDRYQVDVKDGSEILQHKAGTKKSNSPTTETKKAVAYITGDDYVGGIVGYNDVEAIVEDYELTGGYIKGTGCYVGGYVGFNASVDLLIDKEKANDKGRTLISNPNEVTGLYCVGGSIGANVINLDDADCDTTNSIRTITTNFKTDNFLGNITAKESIGNAANNINGAIAGGYMGYNRIVTINNDAAGKDISAVAIQKYAEVFKADLMNQKNTSLENKKESYDVKDAIADVTFSSGTNNATKSVSDKEQTDLQYELSTNANSITIITKRNSAPESSYVLNNNNNQLIIVGKTDEKQSANLKFGSIKAGTYVGGVMGYNDEGTSLFIKDVKNMTPVEAKHAIENAGENYSTNSASGEFTYSYAGGIIGKVCKNVTLDTCSNQDVGDIITTGTYIGGICEINEGIITNCAVSSIGKSSHSYVGGIVGINKIDATVSGCTFEGKTITGKNYVGGIAAENYGTITGITVNNGKVNASGDIVGGIVGHNYTYDANNKGIIHISSSDSDDSSIKVTVSSSGKYVGGIVGKNEGIIRNMSSSSTPCIITGTISGDEYVGGTAGKTATSVNHFYNQATVTAKQGNVGGIVGGTQEPASKTSKNADEISAVPLVQPIIASCFNSGTITASKAGDAGGIIGENYGMIYNCQDYGTISAANGNCGGIAGKNANADSYIANCLVKPQEETTQTITFWSKALRWMKSLLFGNESSTFLTFRGRDSIGGVCGENNGSITDTTVENLIVENTAKSGQSNIGAITGINNKTISVATSSASSNPMVKNCTVQTYTSGSSIGGVAGKNAGNITGKYTHSAADSGSAAPADDVSGVTLQFADTKATYANIGGIAGINENTSGSDGISNCKVTANITGDLGTAGTGYGGISGINSGTISNCAYDGTVLANGTADNIVNIGGITGKNTSSTSSVDTCYIGTSEDTIIRAGEGQTTTASLPYMGYVGGLVGWNYGTVKNSDNSQSQYNVTIDGNKGHIGGIVGYNMAGATVTGTKEAANIKFLTTGKNWSVTSYGYSNDCGTGGIIGYNGSGNDINYVKNYAEVQALWSADNVTAGGLVGRNENRDNNAFSITNFENYGKVRGMLAGGAIGRIKFKGASFKDCNNYGNISSDTSNSKMYASGYVASMYLMDAGTSMIFDTCANYGNITGTTAGGLLAHAMEMPTISAIFSNCVNEGCINAGTSGGILATKSLVNASFYRCRNYGNSTSTAFGGMVKDGFSKMEGCFTFGNSQKLTEGGNNSNISNSYFLVDDGGDDGVVLAATNSVSCNGAIVNGNPVANLYTLENRFAFSSTNATDTKTVTFNFKEAYPLTNFGVYWGNSETASNVRRYKFKVSCTEESNEVSYLTKSGAWRTDSEAYTFTSYGTNSPDKSYWSTVLDENKNINSITLTITEVMNGEWSGNEFVGTTTNPMQAVSTVCLYAITAATGTEGKSYTSTVKDIYTNIGGYETAESAYEGAKKTENTARNDYIAKLTPQGKDKWDISATPDNIPANNKLENVFNNILLPTTTNKIRAVVNQGAKTKITLNCENGAGEKLTGLFIKWAGNKDDSTAVERVYDYTVTMTYANGSTSVSKYQNVKGKDYNEENSPLQDSIGELNTDEPVTKIEITIDKVTQAGNDSVGYTCLWEIRLYQMEEDSSDAALSSAYNKYVEAKTATKNAKTTYDNLKEKIDAAIYYQGDIINAGVVKQAAQSNSNLVISSYGTAMYVHKDDSVTEKQYFISNISPNATETLSMQIEDLQTNPRLLWKDTTSSYSEDATKKGNRQKVCEEIEEQLVHHYEGSDDDALANPKEIAIEESGGVLNITWKHSTGTYYADQLIYVVENAEENGDNKVSPITISYGIERYSMEIPSAWYGENITIYIRSVKNESCITDYKSETNAPPSGVQDNCSNWSSGTLQSIKQPQANPIVHLEAVKEGNGTTEKFKFISILENPKEYAPGTKINVTIAGKSSLITVGTNRNKSSSFDINSSEGNQTLSAKAVGEGDKSDSATVAVQSFILGSTQLKDICNIATTFNDFYGDLPENLSNRLTLGVASGRKSELYVNTELLIENYEFDLGSGTTVSCELSVSQGESHITDRGGTMTSNLSGLPTDLFDHGAVTVRSYPWKTQAEKCWYGHMVRIDSKEEMTEAELINYMNQTMKNDTDKVLKDDDNADGVVFVKEPNTDTTNTVSKINLNPGYVLRKLSNGNYEIYYSSLLDMGSKQCKEKTYQKIKETSSEKITDNGSYSKPIQSEPVIITDEMPLDRNNTQKYTFSWDGESSFSANAQYEVKLYGIADDETEVLLDTVEVKQDTVDAYNDSCCDVDNKKWQYSFKDTEDNWYYKTMKLTVVRRGEVISSTNATQMFPSSTTEEFNIPAPLSQISRPTLSVHEEGGIVQKNTLVYDIEWDGVPTTDERKETSGYDVTVKRADTDTESVEDFTDERWVELNSLYQGKGNTQESVVNEYTEASYSYKWTESTSDNISIDCTMELAKVAKTEEPESFSITKNLTKVWHFTTTENEKNENETTMPTQIFKKTIDLQDYARGEQLDISVKAIAEEHTAQNEQKYRNGPEGVVRQLTLPSRLAVPNVNFIKEDKEYSASTFQVLTTMQNDGITLGLKDDSQANELQAKYEIAIAVYENKPENSESDKSKISAGNDSWNDGARETFVYKEDSAHSATTMNGDLSDAAYTIKRNDIMDYAGMWLKIALRSVSESNISSMWTDEDAGGETQNYCWIHIPRIQLETELFTALAQQVQYNQDALFVDQEASITGGWTLEQTALQFSPQDHAEGYKIQMIRSKRDSLDSQNKTDGFVYYYVDWLYLIKTEGGYQLFYNSTDPDFNKDEKNVQGSDENTPTNNMDSQSVYLGLLSDGNKIVLTREETLLEEESLHPVSYVELKDSGIKLVLPDTEKNNNNATSIEDLFTSQVAIQAVTFPTTDEETLNPWYHNSKIYNWYRTAEMETSSQETEDYKDAPVLSENSTEIIKKDGENRFRFQAEVAGSTSPYWLVLQFQLIGEDAGGNIVRIGEANPVYTMSVDGNGISSVDSSLLLPYETTKIQDLLDTSETISTVYLSYRYAGIEVGSTTTSPKAGLTKWSAEENGDWNVVAFPLTKTQKAEPAVQLENGQKGEAQTKDTQEDVTSTETGNDNTVSQENTSEDVSTSSVQKEETEASLEGSQEIKSAAEGSSSGKDNQK